MTAVVIILAAAVLLLAFLIWEFAPFVHAGLRHQVLTEQDAVDHCRPLSHAVNLIELDHDEDDELDPDRTPA